MTAQDLRPARGPKPAQTLDKIAQTAILIADAEGLDAVSMRRLAGDLGTKATSLYRYVPSKDALLDLMADAALGEAELPQPTGIWRDDLAAIARAHRTTFHRHPWLLTISVRSEFGANGLATTEATLTALDGLELVPDHQLTIAATLLTFTRGHALREIAERDAEARSGLSRDQWMLAQTEVSHTVHRSERFARMRQIMDDATLPHDPVFFDTLFDAGLDTLLDGVETRFLHGSKKI